MNLRKLAGIAAVLAMAGTAAGCVDAGYAPAPAYAYAPPPAYYYPYYPPGYAYAPYPYYYGPRSYSSFSLSFGSGYRRHHHHHHW